MSPVLIALLPTLGILFGVFGIGLYNIHALRGRLVKTNGRILHTRAHYTFLGFLLRYGPRPTHAVDIHYSYQVDGKTFTNHGKLYFVGKGPADDYVAHHARFQTITVYYFDTHPQDARLIKNIPKTAAYVTAAMAIFAIGVISTIASAF